MRKASASSSHGSSTRRTSKKTAKPRNKKFVLWLHNKTDDRDDEWLVIWAKTRSQATKKKVKFNEFRFFRGSVLTAAEFRKETGMAA